MEVLDKLSKYDENVDDGSQEVKEGGQGDEKETLPTASPATNIDSDNKDNEKKDNSNQFSSNISTDVLSKLSGKDDDNNQDRRNSSQDSRIAKILQAGRRTPGGEFTPNIEEFREDIDEEELGIDRLDPRFHDLPQLRYQSQSLGEIAGKTALKTPFQAVGEFVKLAGFAGDATFWDNTMRGLANYMSNKTTGEDVVDPQGEEAEYQFGNIISDIGKKWNKKWDEMLPVQRDPSYNKGEVFRPGDPAWWSEDVIGQTVEMLGGFGLLSGGLKFGGGLLAKGLGKGLRAGSKVSSLRGGAKVGNALGKAGIGGRALATGFAEGMLVADQRKEQILKQEYEKIKEENPDLSEQEIQQRAKASAGQKLSVITGINSVIIPALNLTGAMTMTRGSRRSASRMADDVLEESGEGFKNVEDYLSRVEDASLAGRSAARRGKEYARESAFEATEELGAQVSEEEGTQFKEEDAPGVGERLTNAIFTPQAALEASMGAFAGGGQYAIQRNAPTIETEEGEGVFGSGYTSRARLEKRREAELVAEDKKVLEERINEVVDAKKKLAEAKELEKNGNEVKAWEKRDEAMSKIKASLNADVISRGIAHQLTGIYEDIKNMDEETASEYGFDTDPESDQYYERVADEQIEDIENYKEEYQELNNQYNFGVQEEFAQIPKMLLNLSIQEDNAQKRVDKAREEIERLEREEPTEEEVESRIDELARKEVDRQKELESLQKQQEAIEEMRDIISNWQQTSENLTLRDILEANNLQLVSDQLRENLPDVLLENIKDLDLESALEFAEFSINKRRENINKLKQTDHYREFLDENDLKDNELNRLRFLAHQNQIRDLYKKKREKLEDYKNKQELKKDIAKKRFNFFTSSKGRQQLLDRAKGYMEDTRKSYIKEGEEIIKAAQSEDEIDQILEKMPSAIQEELQDVATEKKEELDTEENKEREQEEPERTQEEVKEEYDEKAENVNEEVTQEEEGGDQEPQSFGNIQEKEQQTEEKEEAEATKTEENVVNEPNDSQREEMESTVDEFVDNYLLKFDIPSDDTKRDLKEKVGQLTDGKFENNSDFKNNLYKRGLERYYEKKAAKEARKDTREDQEDETEEESDRPVENVDKSGSEETVEADTVNQKKLVNTASAIAYNAVPFNETEDGFKFSTRVGERSDLEFPLMETPFVNEGDEITYRVMSRSEAEDAGFDNLDEFTFREDIPENGKIDNETIDNLAIEIRYTKGDYNDRLGYQRRPSEIKPENTVDNNNEVSNNIETQEEESHKLRKTVARQVQDGNVNVTGEINNKSGGHLTINYKTNNDGEVKLPLEKEFQRLSNAFPNQNLEFFVISGGQPDVGGGEKVNIDNLHNNKEYFRSNEGTAGVLVEMGDGKRLAVPVWLPKVKELDADGENIAETIYQIALRSKAGESIENTADLSNPNEVENYIGRLVYTTFDDPSNLLNNIDGRRRTYVSLKYDEVSIVDQQRHVIYTTSEQMLDEDENAEPLSENKGNAIEALGQMRINVKRDEINDRRSPNDFSLKVLRANNNGELSIEEYQDYNTFIKNYIQTDLDSSYSVQMPDGSRQHLPYEQPRIETEVNITKESGDEIESPNIPNNSGSNSAVSSFSDLQENATQQSTKEAEEDSDVAGDTEDVKNTTTASKSPANVEEDIKNYLQSQATIIKNKGTDAGSEKTKTLDSIVDKLEELVPGNTEILDANLNYAGGQVSFKVKSKESGKEFIIFFTPEGDPSVRTGNNEFNDEIRRLNENPEEMKKWVYNNVFPKEFEKTLFQDDLAKELDIKKTYVDTAVAFSIIEPFVNRVNNIDQQAQEFADRIQDNDDIEDVDDLIEESKEEVEVEEVAFENVEGSEDINSHEDLVEYFELYSDWKNAVGQEMTNKRWKTDNIMNKNVVNRAEANIEEAETKSTALKEALDSVEKPSVAQVERFIKDVIKGESNDEIIRIAERGEGASIENQNPFRLSTVLTESSKPVTPIQMGINNLYRSIHSSLNTDKSVGEKGAVINEWLNSIYEEVGTESTKTELQETVETSSIRDLRDQIEQDLERRENQSQQETLDEFQNRLDNIDTPSQQSTDELNDSINEVEDVIDSMEDQGLAFDDEGIYSDAQSTVQDLREELNSRSNRDIDKDQEDHTEDDLDDGLFDEVDSEFFNQEGIEQNTYTPEAIYVKDVEGGSRTYSDRVLQSEVERDIAEENITVKCKR